MHRNPDDGRVYIGCTKKRLSDRFRGGRAYHHSVRFYEDIQKYGFDFFEHILIKDGLSQSEAYSLEEELIKKYDSMNPLHGYNMRSGGAHNVPCEDVGRHISQVKAGHEVSEETREKLRQYGKRPVVQLGLDGSYIATFDSLTSAAKSMNCHKNNIWAVCNGKKPTCRGFKWDYLDRFNDAKRAEESDRVIHGIGGVYGDHTTGAAAPEGLLQT